jgi:DNA-directed RNA polymerase subunit omega
MTHIPYEDLMDKVDSKYRLVIIAAKRSRQLNQGTTPLVQPKGHKPTYIALEEMGAGKVEYTMKSLEEVTKTGVFAEAVKPTWFREIVPEGVAVEEDTEEEEEVGQEIEGVAPAEAEGEAEEVHEVVEGEMVDLNQIEKVAEEEDEG